MTTTPQPERRPSNDEVICPNCVHQFRAIPVNVQTRLAELERQCEASRSGVGTSEPTFEVVRDAIATRMAGHTVSKAMSYEWGLFLRLLRAVKAEECAFAATQPAPADIRETTSVTVCCQEYEVCNRPCTPRGEWLAKNQPLPSAPMQDTATPRTDAACFKAFNADGIPLLNYVVDALVACDLERDLATSQAQLEYVREVLRETQAKLATVPEALTRDGE